MDIVLVVLAIFLSCAALVVSIYLYLTRHSPPPGRVVRKEASGDMLMTVGPETKQPLVINGMVAYRMIEGFEYEEGHVYKLRVAMRRGHYRLVEVVSKEPLSE